LLRGEQWVNGKPTDEETIVLNAELRNLAEEILLRAKQHGPVAARLGTYDCLKYVELTKDFGLKEKKPKPLNDFG